MCDSFTSWALRGLRREKDGCLINGAELCCESVFLVSRTVMFNLLSQEAFRVGSEDGPWNWKNWLECRAKVAGCFTSRAWSFLWQSNEVRKSKGGARHGTPLAACREKKDLQKQRLCSGCPICLCKSAVQRPTTCADTLLGAHWCRWYFLGVCACHSERLPISRVYFFTLQSPGPWRGSLYVCLGQAVGVSLIRGSCQTCPRLCRT